MIVVLKNNDDEIRDKRRLFYSILRTHFIKAVVQHTVNRNGDGHFRVVFRDFRSKTVKILDGGDIIQKKLKDWKK